MESTDEYVLEKYTVSQLKEELKLRLLPCTGNKSELVTRLSQDNMDKISKGTIEILKEERQRRDSQLMEYKELQEKLKIMSIQVNQPQPSKSSSDHNLQSNIELKDILLQIAQTQGQIAQNMSPTFQIFSTSDTSNAIPLFGGNRTDSASEWVRQVERIASLANWSQNLTLVNASMRLRGPAHNWHKVVGKNINSWLEWKESFTEHFKNRMSFAEFITFQSQRTLRTNETISDYIYVKNAMLEKSPTHIPDADRVSLILEGILDARWSTPLAVQCCKAVDELINHADALDSIRKVQRTGVYENKNTVSYVPQNNVSRNENTNYKSNFIKKYNPETDKTEEQTCFRCKKKGHVSYNCTMKTETNIKNEASTSAPNPLTDNLKYNKTTTQKDKYMNHQINCIQDDIPTVTLIPVTVNGNIEVKALPDSGSVVTLIDKKIIPADTEVYPWQKGAFKVAGNIFTPIGWISARIQVGKIDYIMPQIGICTDLPVDMIIGKDWQLAVYARIIHEPDGRICIITPTHTESFPTITTEQATVACCIQNQHEIITSPTITDENVKEIMEVVDQYPDIFKNDDNDIGEFPDFELKIELKHDNPVKCKPYRLPEPERQFLRQTVEKWLTQNVCRLSESPYAAPMFVVEQPQHSTTPYRPVVDYSRTINPITKLDPQPIERMDDIVNKISQFIFKFKLDIYHAYHNIKIREEDIYKTAVITQDHHVEFMRVMFGLVGGPSIMSKVINTTYGKMHDEGIRLYYDDITGGADSIEKLKEILHKVFTATREKNLKLNKEKCNFITTILPLFGRLVGYKEERPDPKCTSAVAKYETLKNVKEVRSFLGFANVFRKYIQNYSMKAKPLNDLLKKDYKDNDTIEKRQTNKNMKIQLTTEQQQSFEKLKEHITNAPILAYFQQDAETIVETDSSYTGMAACLIQIQNGEKKVIEYASRCLKDAETRYHINELEVTAVHWAIVSRFRIYLLGKHFTLITDSYSTAYIINKSKLNRKFARYVIDLAPYDFTPVHRPGKQNAIADHLSRYPLQEMCMMIISSNEEKLKIAQQSDNFIKSICTKLNSEENNHHVQQIRQSYKMENGILIHVNEKDLFNKEKIVIPQGLKSAILKNAHDDSGHLDFSTTMDRIKKKYWWKTLRQDVKAHTRACIVCAATNRRTKLAYGMMGKRSIPETPMQIISADHIVALPITDAGNTYIFVHIDHATRYVMAKPTCSLSAKDVTETIENDIIFKYGPPLTYISDMAPCFMSQNTQNFFNKYGIEHLPTTPYTPQSNGLVERANANIVSVLTKMAFEHKKDWDKLLPMAMLYINTAKQKTTGYSPFYLLHGYEPRITPNETEIGTVMSDIERNHQLDFLSEARKIALQNIETSNMKNKHRFDLRKLDHNFNINDYVMYEWPQATDNKLTARYKGPYQITKKIGSVCYELTNVQQPTKKKIAHVQFLKPLYPPPNLNPVSDISDISDNVNLHETNAQTNNSMYNNGEVNTSNTYNDDSMVPHVTRGGRHTRRPRHYDTQYDD